MIASFVLYPILLIMWTAFQSFILRDKNNNNKKNNKNNNNNKKKKKKKKKKKLISTIKITSFYESNT